uniref:RdRp catalytic domain-containing protein n=1 Tax=Riboviria sp. TaxID=2585031 RepID=A0A8K1WQ18_9VIRU|nr:MAG: hypothetical protein 1 [Riboviria sp.]
MDPPIEAVVFNKLCETFESARGRVPRDFMERSHFDRAFASIDMSSSPGLPYSRLATTNRLLFCDKRGVLRPEQVDWAWNLVVDRLNDRTFDPIKLFVKAEPMKKEKVAQGRYRLISSISVIDQLIDQMLFGWQNELMMDQWISLPPKVGWSPMVGGYKIFHPNMRMAIDKKAWDWTVKGWMVEQELKLRCWLAHGDPTFADLAEWRYKCLFKDALLVLSSGVVLRQNVTGIMKSGTVNTIMTNSILQILLHYRVCAELGIDPGWLWSMGDDTLQTILGDLDLYLALLREYCLAKDPVMAVEFAGFKFSAENVEPLYPAKHAYNLLYFDPRYRDDVRISYSLLYAKSADSDWVYNALSELGEIPSREFLRAVWNGDD